MAVLNLNYREIQSRRFAILTCLLGGRADMALGLLTHLWVQAVKDKCDSFSLAERMTYLVCPEAYLDASCSALTKAGYLAEKEDAFVIVGIEGRIAQAKRRAQASVANGFKRKTRAKPAKKKTAVVKAAPSALAVDTEEKGEDILLATRASWEAYKLAFVRRFGTDPARNAKVNALIKQFCQRVPMWDAPHVLQFYVGHGQSFYAQRMYPLDLAVKDAESLHAQWKTGRQITRATIEQFEQDQKYRAALDQGAII